MAAVVHTLKIIQPRRWLHHSGAGEVLVGGSNEYVSFYIPAHHENKNIPRTYKITGSTTTEESQTTKNVNIRPPVGRFPQLHSLQKGIRCCFEKDYGKY